MPISRRKHLAALEASDPQKHLHGDRCKFILIGFDFGAEPRLEAARLHAGQPKCNEIDAQAIEAASNRLKFEPQSGTVPD